MQIGSRDGTVHVVLSATGLPPGVSVDPASVRLTLDGRRVAAGAEPAGTAAVAVSRTAVLLIDTSGSMAGPGIAGAKAAAKAFLAAVPADVRVGLVTFADRPVVAARPTTDHASLMAAVDALRAKGHTALYDGVAAAVALAGRSGSRTVVVLSDGRDSVSHSTLADALARLRAAKPIVDAVAFKTSKAQSSILGRFTRVTGGQVLSATGTAAVASAFQQAARDVSGDIVVTAKVPDGLANRQATVTVTATAGATRLADSASVYLTPAPGSAAAPHYGAAPAPVSTGFFRGRSGFYTALGVLFAGLATLVAAAFLTVSRDRALTRFRRRLSVYTLTGPSRRKKREATVLGDNPVAQSAVEWAGRVVARSDLDDRLAMRLEAAGLPMKAPEWLLLHIGAAIGGAFLMLLVGHGRIVPGALGLLVGVLAPAGYLSVKATRRRTAFLAHLPDTLQLMSGGLVAGYSLPQAVDAVVREGIEPVAGEFNRALVETRLGVPIEDALGAVGERMGSRDFDWVVMAIRIQREVGGNLAELLSTVSATLRERQRLRRQVQVLSAEGRLSGYILFGLPVTFALYLWLVRPEYLRPLYTDRIGWAMLLVLAVSLSLGGLWLRKIVRVEV